jgi:hypothetical protein
MLGQGKRSIKHVLALPKFKILSFINVVCDKIIGFLRVLGFGVGDLWYL